MAQLAILGGGSWGTALTIALASRFEHVTLWVHEPELAASLAETGENELYLPGFSLPRNVLPTSDYATALVGADVVIGVTPSQHLRRVFSEALPWLRRSMLVVSATKGLETASLLRMSEVIQEVAGALLPAGVGVLSGPTFAREVAAGEPAALVVASADRELALAVQSLFSGPSFRLYTNSDPTGVELGAALKNIIAIGAGICQGLGLGNNTTAALITRGLAEITRLAVAMGAQARTLAGLAGLGDLVLTCTGELSRNRRVGLELARGRRIDDVLQSTRMVAEGVATTAAAKQLAARHSVEMPIVEQMYEILYRGKNPQAGVRELMERSLKCE